MQRPETAAREIKRRREGGGAATMQESGGEGGWQSGGGGSPGEVEENQEVGVEEEERGADRYTLRSAHRSPGKIIKLESTIKSDMSTSRIIIKNLCI
jgi:hypothetical protein